MADDWFKSVREKPGQLAESIKRFGQIPSRADAIAEQRFPDSARDASQKNAFRHALGTGMMTRSLGNTQMAAGLAKAAGWGWETWGALNRDENTQGDWDDTLHDLNANSIGAKTALDSETQERLVERLDQMARESVMEPALKHWMPNRERMTRSEQ